MASKLIFLVAATLIIMKYAQSASIVKTLNSVSPIASAEGQEKSLNPILLSVHIPVNIEETNGEAHIREKRRHYHDYYNHYEHHKNHHHCRHCHHHKHRHHHDCRHCYQYHHYNR